MDTKTIINEATDRMKRTVGHLDEELLNIRAGKASTNVLNSVFVDYYGSQTPVSGVASVTVPDARTILIQPWDKNFIRPIEKAIIDSNIGLTPSNNGETIRLTIPPLTEDRRKELLKKAGITPSSYTINIYTTANTAFKDADDKYQKEVAEMLNRDPWGWAADLGMDWNSWTIDLRYMNQFRSLENFVRIADETRFISYGITVGYRF